MATFHPFPRLATELRHLIWEMAFDDWSVTELFWHQNRILAKPVGWGVPLIGQACSEARSVMQRIHTKTQLQRGKSEHIWVDWKTTVLSLGDAWRARHLISYVSKDLSSQVTCVVINFTTLDRMRSCFGQFLGRWPSLKTIVIRGRYHSCHNPAPPLRTISYPCSHHLAPPLDAKNAVHVIKHVSDWLRDPSAFVSPEVVLLKDIMIYMARTNRVLPHVHFMSVV